MRALLVVLGLCAAGCKGGGDGSAVDLDGLVGILVTPEAPVVPVGDEVPLTATGLFDDRSTADLTAVVDWHADDPGVASVSSDLDEEGVVRGESLGETTVWAEVEDISSSVATVRVTDATLLGLSVEPASVTLAEGDEVQLVAQAAWSDGTRGDASAQVRWITDDGTVAQLEPGGRLYAAGVGSTNIHAEWETFASNDVPVDVIDGDGGGGGSSPNLRVSSVTGEGAGGLITLTITVANDGATGASGFWVDSFLDPSGTPEVGDYGDDYTYVDYVGPGSTVKVSASLDASEGSHTVAVLIDSEGAVAESDEGDNVWSGSVSVGGASESGPNLTPTYFDWLADWDYIYYYVDIYNGGTEGVGPFYVDLYVDSSYEPSVPSDGDDWVDVTWLDAGDTTYADFLIETTCGDCSSWVLVDSYDEVDETDEDDNAAGPLDVYNDGYGYYYY